MGYSPWGCKELDKIGTESACMLTQSCPTVCDLLDSSLPGSSVPGFLQAKMLEWVAISYFRGSSRPKDRTHVSCDSCIGSWILYHCATWEAYSITTLFYKENRDERR